MNRFFPDPFIPALLATVVLATLLPASGLTYEWLDTAATAAVMLLFFLHGVKLPRENLVAAVTHWRLHLLILATTFAFIPLAGVVLTKLWPSLLPENLWVGVVFLCALPSTVQMSIAFTSMAKGNVAASVTSAAASNLLGIVLTPLIAGALLHSQGGDDVELSEKIGKVLLLLLVPFVVGHLLRPLLASWAVKQKQLISWSDRLTILLSVYAAFSEAVNDGIWSKVPFTTLLVLVAVCATLLTLAMLFAFHSTGFLGLSTADRRSALYCGSFKSLVSGVPMAKVLFPPAELGAIILPIIIYHQLQLMVSATIAPRQASRTP
jgi:solute carrier family 10 (sodium/bile acid cotransporter), member 7